MFAGLDIPWLALGYAAAAAICLTLAAMHLTLWARADDVDSRANLLFAVIAVAVAGTGAFEFLISRSTTIEGVARVLRLAHLPVGLFLLTIPWFIRVLFGAGRTWLALLSNGVCLAAIVIDLLSPYSRIYVRITGIERLPLFGGELFTRVTGEPHPWRWVLQVGVILILVFVADAAVSLWRRGGRRRALVIGGGTMLTLILAQGWSALITAGILRAPFTISFAFLLLVGGMAYELVDDARRASALGKQVVAQAESLQEQEERLRLATDAADIGIWSWDSGRQGIWMTSRTRAMLSIDPTTTITWHQVLERVHPADRERVFEEARRLQVAGGDFVGEFRLAGADAGTRWLVASGRLELPSDGSALHVTGVLQDITDRREAAAELEMRRTEVAHLSRVLMLSEMSGAIVHELSQPLTAIQGNAHAALRFLEHEPAELGEVREALSDIVTQNRHATDVIGRLRLLLAKGQRRSEPLDANQLVTDVLNLAGNDLARQDIQVATQLTPVLSSVFGDEVLLSQVLLNLVNNAAEAMADTEPGERRLTVATEMQDGGIEISVGDRGRGIPEGDLERIFRPFYTTRPTGTGLGLAVSRTIMNAHGGRIWASPGDGDRGAILHVLVPTAPEVAT